MTDDDVPLLEPFDVVLLRPGHPHPRALDGTAVDLATDEELTGVQQQALVDSSVRISPADLTERSRAVLAELPVPACFERSGWLQDHRALVLDAEARRGPVRFELHDVYGLQIEEDM